ncbi:MAG: phosphoenolpyruvate--protein phosphotransferase [Pseudoflavonifractor capillosus]|uniref:phosphoenolpyruvate--protein phosphotransferase n=1 Tax=Pseudoflavonifractor capillosus TaxID=106588 RepID=UPI0023F9FB86|nr:phosphoenolpyruvate--protein phosphotransferase [Pseudoflavonifractor capillosus]MCI5928570.1 phosphoenolpyruvate--protein phosphotransferase [Pseudoflavonifractor capillosus]MDY4661530.1 phosphoenolpyruvate--protein phosphotransferase [Pseudoflavonifractor capillosus]
MTVLHGEGVSRGVASGNLRFLRRDAQAQPRREVADAEAEVLRFDQAREEAMEQLGTLYVETCAKLGEEKALLFQIHQMMLEDLDYCESITGMIRDEHVNAEYAVEQTGEQFSQMFAQMDDAYMKERSADVLDVSRRVIRLLTGQEDEALGGDTPCIIAADDLVPSETARLDRSKVLGFITARGSSNSHTAIFARTMGIPAVVGLGDGLLEEFDGKNVFVDGASGEVFVAPDAQTTAELENRRDQEAAHRRYLDTFRGREAVTPDGHRILVCANIGAPKDLEAVLGADADGIGLFRSEFLYLGRDNYPPEEDQYQAYRQVLEAMEGRMVVIRTLDIGADKQADYFELPKEENPAMGLRAIRICLTRPEVFRTQLRALYRASAHGKLGIMFPMITSVSEVLRIKEICAQVREELKAEGIPFDEHVELGIMIETPAAAVISDLLAQEVDFFSIGTNDLTQYTLAVDRQNAQVESFCDRHHEALLRLIRTTVENAHKAGIWAGICGELAADTTLTDFFMEVGVDELSMTPGAILETKAKILDR